MITKSLCGTSRPSSITRCSRESYTPEFETLPDEGVSNSFELNEEVLEIEDFIDEEEPQNYPTTVLVTLNASTKDLKTESNTGM